MSGDVFLPDGEHAPRGWGDQRPAWWTPKDEREFQAFLARAVVDLEAGVVRIYDRAVDETDVTLTYSLDRGATFSPVQRVELAASSSTPAPRSGPAGEGASVSDDTSCRTSPLEGAARPPSTLPHAFCTPCRLGLEHEVPAPPESRVEVVAEPRRSPPAARGSVTSPARDPVPTPARRARSTRLRPAPRAAPLVDAMADAIARGLFGFGRRAR